MAKICPNCFRSYDGPCCLECGFSAEEYRNPCTLPLYTKLKGKYILGRVLGKGGFGITYLALDAQTNSRRAIKEYYPDRLSYRNGNDICVADKNREYFEYGKEKFFMEACLLSGFLKSPEIVDVYDVFEENGTVYMVMEYIDGPNLRNFMQTHGKPSIDTASKFFVEIALTLALIHSKNLLHRDINPKNVMINPHSDCVVIDFGAARQYTDIRSTGLSVLMTRGFAPVEQYSTKAAQGPYTDIYSLGATIYYFLTDIMPQEAVDRRLEDKLIPIREIRPDITPALEKCLTKCLMVKPEDRYQYITELLNDYQSEDTELVSASHFVQHEAVRKPKDVLPKSEGLFAKLKKTFAHAVNPHTGEAFAVVRAGELYTESYRFSGEIILGRAEGCGIRVNDGYVSERHLALRVDKNGCFSAVDNSTNGTFQKNGARLERGLKYVFPFGEELAVTVHDEYLGGNIRLTVTVTEKDIV